MPAVANKLSLKAQYLVECLNLPEAAQVDDAAWEVFQLEHLNDTSKMRIENKSRQIAWSFTSAAEAVAKAHLYGTSSLFVSINLDESAEKIRYAKRVHENVELSGKPKIKRDNVLGVEFDNGARILSVFAVRGKAQFDVYFDEYAHKRDDRSLYTAALPIISKGGQLRIGSSPLGESGMFWEIFEQKFKSYPGFTRKRTPWWEVEAFCTDVAEARRKAPKLETHERVERFGEPTIQLIYQNMLREDFCQEYEASYVDEATAWIPWDDILACEDAGLECVLVECRGSDISKALRAIKEFVVLEAGYGVGVDIGRTNNKTEIFIGGKTTTKSIPLRLAITLDNTPFDEQQEVLEAVLSLLPITKMLIDKNGLGMMLAEKLERKYGGKAQGFDFTNPSKEVLAVNSKMLFQQRKLLNPIDRELSYQVHSIKKKLPPARTTFSTLSATRSTTLTSSGRTRSCCKPARVLQA